MIPEEQVQPPFAKLASHWTAAGVQGADLAEATLRALGQARPRDLEEVAGLVRSLLGQVRSPETGEAARRALFALLDRIRRRAFTRGLRAGEVEGWARIAIETVDRADYTVGELLRSREATDPRSVAMRVIGADAAELTVADLARRTRSIARGLLALLGDEPEAKVAILSENCLEAALCDLACLTNGIVDLPLPANAFAEQVVYMLRHSGAQVLLAQDEEQLAKVLPALPSLPALREMILFDRASAERHGLLCLDQVVGQSAGDFDDAARAARAAAVRSRDLATVMYTSGTTGNPKGIVFNHLNVVSKRFCRGLALPEIGEGDVFLCYLPLYHTFGRYLEMLGTLHWSATYVFARSTERPSLAEDFRAVKPSVFISVPKKWAEMHEAAVRGAASEDPLEVAAHLRSDTGGRLRLGLSAAGYLDPAVFRAFHAAGVELCSGYGMTEATGGILMTPPGEYVEGSVGKPLPGIECRRAEDGELLIRGLYVSTGYFHPTGAESGPDAEGWFGTGDLVAIDERGHFQITGRKKEIYKNRAGQTIAPQRIENLFRDFDAVGQAFLVGDRRDHNTLLLWPNYEGQPQLKMRTAEALRELLSSLVASANRFLAPFERVVAFEVLPRPLDQEHGELTQKNTFKRDTVERNWKALIDAMYQRGRLSLPVDSMVLRVPNWVLRELGVLQNEVWLRDGALVAGGRTLPVAADPEAPGSLRIGDLAYAAAGSMLDLGAVLARPALWLGNQAMRRFLGEEAFLSLVSRRRKREGEVRLDARCWSPPALDRLPALLEAMEQEPSFDTLHAAGELLRADRPDAHRAIAHLEKGFAAGKGEVAALSRALLRRAAHAPDEEVARRAVRALLPAEEPARLLDTLGLFLERLGPLALRDDDLAALGERFSEPQVQVLLDALTADSALAFPSGPGQRHVLAGAMRLVTAAARAHPVWYARVRMPLAWLEAHEDEEVAARAAEELDRLRRDFSAWIGPNLRRAIDPATGQEYGWRDVVSFDPGVDQPAREILLRALTETTLVRASVFLFYRGALVTLADFPPGGASVAHLGTRHGKSVYRLSLQSRAREGYDIAVNVAKGLAPAELNEEIHWLLALGAPPPFVEAFGGYYPEYGIFTEEFIAGENVARQVARLERQGNAERLRLLWPFLARTAFSAHVAFWDRTRRRLALADPSPAAFIVPAHDYHSGARLVSIADRSRCEGFDEVVERFLTRFLGPVLATHAELDGEVDEPALLSAAIEALGLERALPILEAARGGRRGAAAAAFLETLQRDGYTPERVYFAVRRYRRWLSVTPSPTEEARAGMLGELWGTYRLAALEESWRDTRIRFFRQTVFAEARPELGAALDRLMARARSLPAGGLDLEAQVAAIRGTVQPTAEEDYFLARMTYRHLDPSDVVSLISLPSGDREVTEPVVGFADAEGERFWVRSPTNPREVARLLQIFHDSNLPVTFSAEHEFLIALDGKETVMGGIFYRQPAPERVHFEKVVVAHRHRGKAVSDGVMRELVRRLRARGVRRLETGFFQPEYLRRFGFRTDPTSGGLVLDLEDESRFRW